MLQSDVGYVNIEADSAVSASRRVVRNSAIVGDIENQSLSTMRALPASVYKFRPSTEVPKLRMLSSRTDIGLRVTLKAVVRRKSILIVTDKQGVWWNCTCSGYQGWVNVTEAMIQNRVLIPIDRLRRFEDWRGNYLLLLYDHSTYFSALYR